MDKNSPQKNNDNPSFVAAANDNDESAIRGLYQQLIDGWNAGSGDAFADPFEEDSDQVAFDGTHFKGRQEIATFTNSSLISFSKALDF